MLVVRLSWVHAWMTGEVCLSLSPLFLFHESDRSGACERVLVARSHGAALLQPWRRHARNNMRATNECCLGQTGDRKRFVCLPVRCFVLGAQGSCIRRPMQYELSVTAQLRTRYCRVFDAERGEKDRVETIYLSCLESINTHRNIRSGGTPDDWATYHINKG